MTRKTCYFSGTVQGVGFRFTAQAVSRRFHLSGYVQNLRDGRVKLVAEGDASELDRFIEAIKSEMGGYVRAVDCETQSATGEFSGFAIHH